MRKLRRRSLAHSDAILRKLDFIAVEGPIGVGKSTLAQRLATDLGATVLAEAPDDVPFLNAFYADRKANALPAQLCFLLQRARQIDQLRQQDLFKQRWIADFLFSKDALFAELNLAGHELDLYHQIFRRLAWDAPVPDRVVYLQAPVPLLMERIRKRGRAAESLLDEAYLEQVSAAYHKFFESYSAAPVVWVDAGQMDFVHSAADYRELLAALGTPGKMLTLPGGFRLGSS